MLRRTRPSVILGATVSCKEAAMLQSVFGFDGQIHLENQVSSQRFDFTTGEVKTVIPTAGNMSASSARMAWRRRSRWGRCAKHWASLASIGCLIITND